MRRHSLPAACLAAALILLAAAAVSLPAGTVHTGWAMTRLGQTLATRSLGHAWTAASALRTAAVNAPALLQERSPAQPAHPPASHDARVCRREETRMCVQSECPKAWLERRVRVLFLTQG